MTTRSVLRIRPTPTKSTALKTSPPPPPPPPPSSKPRVSVAMPSVAGVKRNASASATSDSLAKNAAACAKNKRSPALCAKINPSRGNSAKVCGDRTKPDDCQAATVSPGGNTGTHSAPVKSNGHPTKSHGTLTGVTSAPKHIASNTSTRSVLQQRPTLYKTTTVKTPLSSSSSKHSVVTSSVAGARRYASASMRSYRSSDSLAKNAFGRAYIAACVKHNTRPSPCVKINALANSVEVWGDRMVDDDWQAAMEALSGDTSTHYVRIQMRRNNGNSAKSYETLSSVTSSPKNIPASGMTFVGGLIASSVYDVLVNSNALVCLELQNVLFDEQMLDVLFSGVKANRTLQHLSLAYCRIGDSACLALCRVLRNKPNVRSVDLSGCSLSPASATGFGLVDLIKKQQIRRHEECWAHSLRYRSADPNIMHGLRRLTLNDNPGLGDDGVADLFEVLKDDLFVKALDLQNCGLTDRSGQLAYSSLLINDTLVVLDVRNNGVMPTQLLEMIMVRLYKNNMHKAETNDWKWTKIYRNNVQAESSSTLA